MRTFEQVKAMELSIRPGETIYAYCDFLGDVGKLHIMYILDSYYSDKKLIVYRVYGKHRQWWHEFMCDDLDLKINIDKAERLKESQKC